MNRSRANRRVPASPSSKLTLLVFRKNESCDYAKLYVVLPVYPMAISYTFPVGAATRPPIRITD